MNKTEFIDALAKKTGFSEAECTKINSILEDVFILGKNHKEKLVEKFEAELKLEKEKAEKLYEDAMGLIGSEVKDKLKHPFKSQD